MMIRALSKSIVPGINVGLKSIPVVSNRINRKYTTGDDADVVVTKKDQILTIRLNRPKKVCLCSNRYVNPSNSSLLYSTMPSLNQCTTK